MKTEFTRIDQHYEPMIVIIVLCLFCIFLISTFPQAHTTEIRNCQVFSFEDGVLILEDSSGNQFVYTYEEYDTVDLSNVGSIAVVFDNRGTDSVLDDEIIEFEQFYSTTGTLLFSEY